MLRYAGRLCATAQSGMLYSRVKVTPIKNRTKLLTIIVFRNVALLCAIF